MDWSAHRSASSSSDINNILPNQPDQQSILLNRSSSGINNYITSMINSTNNNISLSSSIFSTPYDDSTPKAYSFACSVLMLFFCSIGSLGNAISIFVFTRRSMRSSINILLTGLSVVDLSVLLLSVPVFVIPGLNAYQHFGQLRSLQYLIVFGLYQMGMAAQTCSVWTFVLISIERWLAVCRPFHVRYFVTVPRAKRAFFLVSLLAVLYNVIRFWEYRLFIENKKSADVDDFSDKINGLKNRSESIFYNRTIDDYTSSNSDSNSNNNYYYYYDRGLRDDYSYFIGYFTAAYVLVHFFAPFLLILILNAHIIKVVGEAGRVRVLLMEGGGAMMLNQKNNHRGNAEFTDKTDKKNLKNHQNNHQRQTTRMIVMVTAIFIFCNTLPFVLNILEAAQPKLFDEHANQYANLAYLTLDLSNLLVVFNSSINFLVFLIYCRRYRRICYTTLLFRCCCIIKQQHGDKQHELATKTSVTTATALINFNNFNNNNNNKKKSIRNNFEQREKKLSNAFLIYSAAGNTDLHDQYHGLISAATDNGIINSCRSSTSTTNKSVF